VVLQAELFEEIILLDIYSELQQTSFFKDYPYFAKSVIPAKTYRGQEKDVATFQDAALWVANEKISSENVYKIVKNVYSKDRKGKVNCK